MGDQEDQVGARSTRASRGQLPLLPAAAFVLVWSSGYIAGPYGVEGMSPLMLVASRFVLAAVLALGLARLTRGPLGIPRSAVLRICLVGVILNGVQFGAMYLAFDAGLGATLGALLHSLSPVLTVILAAAFLRERLSIIQVMGFVMGVIGVLIVLGPEVDQAGGWVGLSCAAVSVLGLSLGTMGQRWIGTTADPIWSSALQFAAAAPPLLALGLVVEGTDVVRDPTKAIIAIVFLAVVNSMVGLLLLGVLARASGAGVTASIFFLMPPITAVLAWVLLGEQLNARELIGLVVTVVAVAAATRVQPRPATTPPSRQV